MNDPLIGTTGGPFGDPDGSRADLDDVIEFPASSSWIGVRDLGRAGESNRRVRVVVGMKGSGKTVFLRLMQAAVRSEPAVVLGVIDASPPSTAQVVETCQLFPAEVLTERWMQIWRCAILSSVATHVLYDRKLRDLVELDRDDFLSYYGDLFPARRRATSVYGEMLNILQRLTSSGRHAVAVLEDARWHELQDELAELIAGLPPLYLFVDAVDEEFAHAPMFWMRCQKGLFYQVMRFLRDQRLGGRLHIIVCVRDIVLSSVFKSEHGPRYYGDRHIQVLSWDRLAVTDLLREKIAALPGDVAPRIPPGESSLAGLLGFTSLENVERGVIEDVDSYLLRHTFLLPRDIVIMGNEVCAEIRAARSAGGELTSQAFRHVVSRVARVLGDARLRECANHIASDQIPARAARHRYTDTYTASDEYVGGISNSLQALLRGVGVDRFGRDRLGELAQEGVKQFSGDTDVLTVLWQAGLLGYVVQERSHYFGLREIDRFDLPREPSEYVLHPALIDTVGLRAVGGPLVPA